MDPREILASSRWLSPSSEAPEHHAGVGRSRQDNKDEVEIASLAAARNSAPSLRLPTFSLSRVSLLLAPSLSFSSSLFSALRLSECGEHVCLGGPHKLFLPREYQPTENSGGKHDFLRRDLISRCKKHDGVPSCTRCIGSHCADLMSY